MTGILVPRRTRQATVLPSPRCQLRLRIRLQSGKKRIIRVPSAKCTIGSHDQCTIRIPRKLESQVHCVLLRSRGKVVVRSWSEECTINGRTFEIAALTADDTLRIPGATIQIQSERKERKRPKRANSNPAEFGKQLVREIGTRLAHLEQRLVKRQRRLAKQFETRSSAFHRAITEPEKASLKGNTAESPPSPVLVEGLNTLRSAVEDLRAQVEEVSIRPWNSAPTTPVIDHAALIESATAKMNDLVQISMRENRIQGASKFEQIGREFDRIGKRLVDVELKLNLPTSDMIAEQVRPVCEAVDFVRTGLEAIEKRHALDAQRFANLSSGLASLSQSTIEKLSDLSEKIVAPPNLSVVETSLALMNEKVEGLSQDFAKRQERFLTREDLASFMKQLESVGTSQPQFESRFLAIDERFDKMLGQWSQFQTGTESQLRDIIERIESLPAQTAATSYEQVDLTPLEQKIGESRLELADHARAISAFGETQQALFSRLDATTQSIESLQSQFVNQSGVAERIEQLATETAADRVRNDSAIEQTHTAQTALLQQMLALEDRCVYLESELARLSRAEIVTGSRSTPSETASSLAIQCDETEAETSYATHTTPYSSNYYSVTSEAASEVRAEITDAAPSHEPALSSPTSDSAQFTANTRTATHSSSLTDEIPNFAGVIEQSNAGSIEDEAERMPNSIVESLKRSGIWKDESTNSEPVDDTDSNSAEDPRDVVGAAFEADATPPSGIDPGKHPAEQLKKNAWGAPHTSKDENDEESIDAYMERLMQRVTGGTGEVTGAMAVAEHLQRAKAQAAKKGKVAPVEADDSEFEYTPKVAAPEKSADLTALRELAMTSANANIQNYHAATKAKTANEKWIVVVVAMICAMGLCYICINYKSDWSYLAAGAAFMVALYWAIQASFSTAAAKRLTKQEKGAAPSDEKTTSKVDVKLLRNVKKSAGLLDQASAGEAFQALVAEREREKAIAPGSEQNADPI